MGGSPSRKSVSLGLAEGAGQAKATLMHGFQLDVKMP
jgi:hypothetical protein